MSRFIRFLIPLVLSLADLASGDIVGGSGKLKEGKIRYHFDNSTHHQCETVALIGVGTKMGADAYESLSTDIVSDSSLVFIMLDHNPRGMVKLSPKKYAKLVKAVVDKITSLVTACKVPPPNGYIVGGHSAGGQAAINALPSLSDIDLLGFLGLDPFNAAKAGHIDIPGIFWGFARTTCFVTKSDAAALAYNHTTKNRVFYQVANTRARITHCIFTDNGCGGMACPSKKEYSWVRSAVGDTLNRFVSAVKTGHFTAQNFLLSDYDDINVNLLGKVIQEATVPADSKGTKGDVLLPAFA